jgi:hypothetical protein
MTNNNEIVQAAGVPALSPEDIALMQGASHETDFKKEDLATPYLQIVQSTSGYMKRNDPAFIPDAKEGDIIDTLTLKLRQRAAFVPVKFEVHYTEWKPNRGPMVKQWGSDASGYEQAEGTYGTRKTADGNDIVPAGTYYGLLAEEDGSSSLPVVLSLTGTQAKKSRKLNALINALEIPGVDDPPMFSRVFALTSVGESNDQGSWSGWKIEPGPMVLVCPGGRTIFHKAKKLREQVDAGEVRTAAPTPVMQAERAEGAADEENIPF